MEYEFLIPSWEDYELIDCGDGEKLERWGEQITVRPEPQAVWRKSLAESEWQRLATAIFRREGQSEERGKWALVHGAPEQWWLNYELRITDYGLRIGQSEIKNLKFRLGLTSFKHVGLFPEQAANWEYIYNKVSGIRGQVSDFHPVEGCHSLLANDGVDKPKILNLFAYTGGASLAAAAAGAEVVHVDSVRQVVQWASENASASGIEGIHWIVEDAAKFVAREVRRGHKYDGIILDPPAYGRGADGEKWILERDIAPLLENVSQLLTADGFLVINLYSMGLSALVAQTTIRQLFGTFGEEQFGELYVEDSHSKRLPLGVFWRGQK